MLFKMLSYSTQISTPSSGIMRWMLMLMFRESSVKLVLNHHWCDLLAL